MSVPAWSHAHTFGEWQVLHVPGLIEDEGPWGYTSIPIVQMIERRHCPCGLDQSRRMRRPKQKVRA